jgi:hypothetical protein
MRKFLVFPGGVEYELPPLSFEEFDKLGLWSGCNDVAYDQFCRFNSFVNIDRFDKDPFTSEWHKVHVELRPGEPVVDWSLNYGEL